MNRETCRRLLVLALLAGTVVASGGCKNNPDDAGTAGATLSDASDGRNWAGYGRTNGQQHFSPLAAVHQSNVASLGLAWAMDLPAANTVTEPIAIDGVLYFASGLSIVHALDAATGRERWQYDPKVGEVGSLNMRTAWGVRGVAWWQDKIYVGTADGRLIALNALTGQAVWTVQTFDSGDPAYISGAPRVFNGRVLIGFGSTTGAMRGHVTAYDAGSGKQLWRFWTVPGDPGKGFENEAMAMAAKTWSGEWWKFGGGGTVWNSMALDPETDTIYIGTGSPYPWNHRIRSQGKGDNLFTASIVALDGNSGRYKWHYQVTPADTWDHDATMDIELADLMIEGKPRKVLMQAPKNGFFYVIDRQTGELISAAPHARVTWASHIDLRTGRPVELPDARFSAGQVARIAPSSLGAHNWMPMAYSPQTGLAYIPANDFETDYSETPGDWQPPTDRSFSGGQMIMGGPAAGTRPATGSLLAWSPESQKPVWRVAHPTFLNGGILATGGRLVFQGSFDGLFKAYAADTGQLLWQFDAGAPIMAAPISYEAGGTQYVTILTGTGMGNSVYAASMVGAELKQDDIDPRTQARRVLTFAIGGTASLPPRRRPPLPPPDPAFQPEPERFTAGWVGFATHCTTCHGDMAIGISNGPDLRRSAIPPDPDAFDLVVRKGALEARGMPRFPEFDDAKLENIRYYIRARAEKLRHPDPTPPARPRASTMGM